MNLWLSLWCAVAVIEKVTGEEVQYFTDRQPDDYFKRKSLDDCPNRFYFDVHKFFGGEGHGGERAVQGDFQHMAAIGWNYSGIIKYLCGGSLISSKFILTAAHCITDGKGNSPTTVRLGDTHLESTEDDQFSQQIKIKHFRRHPQHTFRRKYHDIALIELEEEAIYNDAICPACLWLEKSAPLEPMNAVGFGETSLLGNLSPTLQKVTLKELRRNDCICRLPISNRTLPKGLMKTQICAAGAHQDTCRGDSGGPLQIERPDVNDALIPLIVGLVSFGTPCVKYSTGVYTRVASYKAWIEKQTGKEFGYLACARTRNCLARKQSYTNMYKPVSKPFLRIGLLWNHTDQNAFRCGATLVDYRFALTSAYCARSKQGLAKYIIVGANSEIVPIESVLLHPAYSSNKPQNDLALLKLSKYLDPNFDLLPACLWREAELTLNYGSMHFSAYSSRFPAPGNFREEDCQRYAISTAIVENGKCSTAANRNRDLLCGPKNAKMIPKVCKIDYGAPILNNAGHENIPHIYGVVSTLSKSCDKELVGIRVAPHIQWIEDTIMDSYVDQLIFSS